jgi:hypothetical protein
MTTPSEFSKNIGRLATRVVRNSDKTVKKVALAIDQTVVLATPVDKGRARANWIASLDKPAEGIADAFDKGGSQAIAAARATIDGYDGEINTEVHITNNLDYIGFLNDGSSSQAPAGFIQTGVRQGVAAVKGARLLED